MILLDTHAWVRWLHPDISGKLPGPLRTWLEAIDEPFAVSAISALEVALWLALSLAVTLDAAARDRGHQPGAPIMSTTIATDPTPSATTPAPLRIYAFRDITAFILATASDAGRISVTVNYVKNADEAHAALPMQRADIVFMSYDDTLSLALQAQDRDIAAVMPVHGGILDLCGELDPAGGKVVIGIDTDSGYARALRQYLHGRYPAPDEYARLQWVRAGATNLRYERLLAGELDATLLNPPYSLKPGIARLGDLRPSIGPYQGVVANINRSSLTDAGQRAAVVAFIRAFRQTVDEMQAQSASTIERLARYYGLSSAEAHAVYQRLWEPDGLAVGAELDQEQLAGTERLFSADTGIAVPAVRTWVLSP